LRFDVERSIESRAIVLHRDGRRELDELLVREVSLRFHKYLETSAGVRVIPSANASAVRSAKSTLKSSLSLKSATAAILSAEAPALLLPTAFVSIQNGHPAN
jgi:hypothetical protein